MLKRTSGNTLIELLAIIGLLSTILGTALAHLDPRREDINTAMRKYVGEFRSARTQAITAGVHYSVRIGTGGVMTVQRHQQAADGTWPVAMITQRITPPSHLSWWMYPDTLEFNTRGTMITANAPVYVYVNDRIGATTRAFAVWPSGQLREEY